MIDQIHDEYRGMSRWEVRDITHGFPEWEDPDGSSNTIQIETILQRNDIPEPDVDAILSEIEELAHAESVFP